MFTDTSQSLAGWGRRRRELERSTASVVCRTWRQAFATVSKTRSIQTTTPIL